MITNEMQIRELITEEQQRGTRLYGHNHSRHEGYAVAKEEFEEFENEYDSLVLSMAEIWKQIKLNTSSNNMRKLLKSAKDRACLMIAEGIQFAAMLEKMEVCEQRIEELEKEVATAKEG